MKTIDFSYFIERYISGEMSEPEKTWFEKELSSNKDLRKEVELRRRTDKILGQQAVIQLRSKLLAIEKARAATGPTAGPVKHVSIKYAAVFTGLVLISALIFLSRKSITVDDIFGKYYTSYETSTPSRSVQTGANNDYTLAIEYYNVHDYRNAALYFSKVIESDPRDMESTMLKGVSNFEGRNYPEAERSFKKVTAVTDNLFIEDAEWYLALCYLRTDEKAKAIEQLATIKMSRSIYSKKAGKILRSIK